MPKPRSRTQASSSPATTVLQADGRAVGVRVRGLSVEAIAGPAAGTRVRLAGRELAIGADPTNALVLADPTVSRFHARIIAGDDGVRIVDRGSVNGTVVNGLRVRDAFLADGAS